MSINIGALSIATGAAFFWAFYQIYNPTSKKPASNDFIKSESMAKKDREIISKSSVHKIFYPLYQRIQQINPLSKNSYEQLKFELEKSGEFNTRPEDIQIAQIANACIYPLFFLILSLFISGNYKPFFISFGVLSGYYMYRAPIRNLKQKKAKFEENKIQDFTRFVTVYLMQSSGNKTVYDALTETIVRSKKRVPALLHYLHQLEMDLHTRGPERALRVFSLKMRESYVDRFVNNVLLSIQQAGGDQKEINMRLRDTLIELQNQFVDNKIQKLKVKSREPVYISVLLMTIYMIVLLGASLLQVF